MGCDIHIYVEKRSVDKNQWELSDDEVFTLDDFDKKYYKKDKGNCPFDWRSYSMFAFLAGVRNYDYCEPISEPRGLPSDISESVNNEYESWSGDAHSASFLTVKELIDFNYDKIFWNRRVTKTEPSGVINGATLANEGEGENISYRDNLGEMFFIHLKELQSLGAPDNVRIVFWFDN